MKPKTLRWIIIIGVVLIVVLAIVAKTAGQNDNTKVAIDKVARHTITEVVTATGKIYPETEVKISPDVSGEVIWLGVQEGDSVQKGQTLVKINPVIYVSQVDQQDAALQQSKSGANNYNQMVAQALTQYELAQKNYERNKYLYNEKIISLQEFEQSETNYKAAVATYNGAVANADGGKYSVKAGEASLQQAKDNLRKTTITAPCSGIISQLNTKLGERVLGTTQYQGTEVLTIADMNRMEVRVDVSETDIAKVLVGDTARIETDAYRNRKFTGIVSKIAVSSKASASATATGNDQVTNYTVHILLLQNSYSDLIDPKKPGGIVFKPGMSASVEIQTQRLDNVLSVPVNAVTTRDWSDSVKKALKPEGIRQVVFVYNATTKSIAIKDVKTGLQDNNYLQITEGLAENEQVVVAPYGAITRKLTDKQKVEVVDKDKLFESKE